MIVVMTMFASFAPTPSMVTAPILAPVIASEAPVVPRASPSALIALEVLTREYAAMMLSESVAGVDAGRAVVAVAGALCTGDAARECDESESQK